MLVLVVGGFVVPPSSDVMPTSVVTVAGEDKAEALAAIAADQVTLDMAGVEFVDSSGLRVLIEAHQEAERAGGSLTLTHPSATVTRLLEISGVDSYLNVDHS